MRFAGVLAQKKTAPYWAPLKTVIATVREVAANIGFFLRDARVKNRIFDWGAEITPCPFHGAGRPPFKTILMSVRF
jgi:hypothetical protein